jgi:hypothetical protein
MIGGAGTHIGAGRSERRGYVTPKTFSFYKPTSRGMNKENIRRVLLGTYTHIHIVDVACRSSGYSLPPIFFPRRALYHDTVTVENLAHLGPRTSLHMQDFLGLIQTLFPPLVRPLWKI